MPRFWNGNKNYIRMQVLAMTSHWGSSFRNTKMRGKEASWVGKLRPTPLSEEYEIAIEYTVGDYPRVTVRRPTLVPRDDGQKIPHLYPGKRLCLFLPRADEWNKELLIATTTVPWASLWLYHYEMWHLTGDWHGGGVHLDNPSEKVETKDE
jgi:hypothetical protein